MHGQCAMHSVQEPPQQNPRSTPDYVHVLRIYIPVISLELMKVCTNKRLHLYNHNVHMCVSTVTMNYSSLIIAMYSLLRGMLVDCSGKLQAVH